MNPFTIRGYHGPKYFCDREVETQNLITAITNQQDVTLYAYRRLGKSALIQHVFHKIPKAYHTIYVDLWGTTSTSDLVEEMANAIIRSGVLGKGSFGEKLNTFVRSLGASLSFGMDGQPSVSLMVNDKQRQFGNLEQVFLFLQNLSSPVVLALDEFQEINNYHDSLVLEGKLRALGQQSTNIRFIFSGSEQDLLNQIFNKYKRPFYQSTRMMELGKIDKKPYIDFIEKHFKAAKKPLKRTLIEYILALTYGHTRYVQVICNHLYTVKTTPQTQLEFDKIYYGYLEEQSFFYAEIPNRVTRQQWEVIKAFSKTGLVKGTTGASFLKLAGITNASSMSRVINALAAKQYIIKDKGGWRLYDVFLEHYLKFVAL